MAEAYKINTVPLPAGGGGASDHGDLTGLTDDDHTIYPLHNYGVGTTNFVAGTGAGAALEAGAENNVLIGTNAGNAITTGDGHVMIGFDTAGTTTVSHKSVVIGWEAMANQAASFAVCIGAGAAKNKQNGVYGVWIGYNCGASSDGNYSVLIGGAAGTNADESNVIIGYQAGNGSNVNDNNILIGRSAGQTCTDGCVMLGHNAGENAAGSNMLYIHNNNNATPLIYGEFDNSMVGINTTTLTEALNVNGAIVIGDATTSGAGTIRYNNGDYEGYTTASGWLSLTSGAGGAGGGGVVDHGALEGLDDDDHTQYVLHEPGVGTNNFVAGANAGESLTTGEDNVIIGKSAGDSLTIGYENVLVGHQAGGGDVGGTYCTYIGFNAGKSGAYNVAVGQKAGEQSTGSSNVFVGRHAGQENTGATNVIVGAEAGHDGDGDSNVFLGYAAGFSETGSNKLYITNSSGVDPLIYGEFDTAELTFNGEVTVTEDFYLTQSGTAPASAADTGTQGEIRWTDDYVYICVNTDTWKRSALSTW